VPQSLSAPRSFTDARLHGPLGLGDHAFQRAPWASPTCAATAPATPGERGASCPVAGVAATGSCTWPDRPATLPPGAQYRGSPRPSWARSRSGYC
jgi:hypothetical protein